MSPHKHILTALRSQTIDPIDFDIQNEADDALYRLLFLNFRCADDGNMQGLRLTDKGLVILSQLFKHWQIPMQEDYKIVSNHLLYLDSTCTMPWHLNKKILTLFESQLAMRAKLIGNLDTLMEVFEE